MTHHFRLWLGFTLFFVYGFAIFIPDEPGLFLFFSWNHWSAYAELIAAGVVASLFIRKARVFERMPPHHPGMGFISGGLAIAAIFIVSNLAMPLFTDSAAGYFTALAASDRLQFAQPLFMALITLGALLVLLTLEPLHEELETVEEEPPAEAVPEASPPFAAAQERVALNPTDLAAQATLHEQLSQETDPAPMLDHAKGYLAALLRQSRAEQAYELLRKCLVRDAAFKPLPECVLPLARFALARKDHKSALRVMNGFSKANPDHVDTAHILFYSARALVDAGERDMARRFLEALIARYPQHPIVREGKELLKSFPDGARPA